MPRESIFDYRLRFDTKIVETNPLLEPMGELLKTHIYYMGLRAYYKLPRLAYPYQNFKALREWYEWINDMDVVPYGPLTPMLPPTPAHALAQTAGLDPDHEQQ